jgi:hypothetical protein
MNKKAKEKWTATKYLNIGCVVVVVLFLIILVGLMIYDRLSGFKEKTNEITGTIVGLYSTPGQGESHSFYLIVALDNGPQVYVDVPYTFRFQVGGRIILRQFTTKKYEVEHYEVIRLLE